MKYVAIAVLALLLSIAAPIVYFRFTPFAIDGVAVLPKPACGDDESTDTRTNTRWDGETLVVEVSEAQNCGMALEGAKIQRVGSSLFVRSAYYSPSGDEAACVCRQNFDLAVPGLPEQKYSVTVYNLP